MNWKRLEKYLNYYLAKLYNNSYAVIEETTAIYDVESLDAIKVDFYEIKGRLGYYIIDEEDENAEATTKQYNFTDYIYCDMIKNEKTIAYSIIYSAFRQDKI